MSAIKFKKYQGTGNDFVMIDNRHQFFPKENTALIAEMCNRKKGIGADGLILLENDASYDFRMVYFNADGNESSMCGNGGRCIVAFAKELGIIENQCVFIAIDGIHHAEILSDNRVRLQMMNTCQIKPSLGGTFLDTGSPHHVEWVQNVEEIDVFKQGKSIRNHQVYSPKGTNVNFVETLSDTKFKIRTFERGVENETLSCGTGATAVAIAARYLGKTTNNQIKIQVAGGELEVVFEQENNLYYNIFLIGPAEKSFEGIY